MVAQAVQVLVLAVQAVMNSKMRNNDYLSLMKKYAEENGVPIIKDAGLAFLLDIINKEKPKRILEIGSAILYSASYMALNSNAKVVTIERDPKMIEEAKKNLKALELEDKITLIEGDALYTFDQVKNLEFDLIFIDAAKAQYEKFFNLYTPLLKKGGVVVSDNLIFHGLVGTDTKDMSRSLRGLVRKIGSYREFLANNTDFKTTLYDEVGDGMGVSYKL